MQKFSKVTGSNFYFVAFELPVAFSHVHNRTFVDVEEHLPVRGSVLHSFQVFSECVRIFLGDHILHSFVSCERFKIIPLSIQLVKIIKRSGPNTDSCDIPLITSLHSECAPLIPTLCLLSSSRCSIQVVSFQILVLPSFNQTCHFFQNSCISHPAHLLRLA